MVTPAFSNKDVIPSLIPLIVAFTWIHSQKTGNTGGPSSSSDEFGLYCRAIPSGDGWPSCSGSMENGAMGGSMYERRDSVPHHPSLRERMWAELEAFGSYAVRTDTKGIEPGSVSAPSRRGTAGETVIALLQQIVARRIAKSRG